jgi:cell division protein FtsB
MSVVAQKEMENKQKKRKMLQLFLIKLVVVLLSGFSAMRYRAEKKMWNIAAISPVPADILLNYILVSALLIIRLEIFF